MSKTTNVHDLKRELLESFDLLKANPARLKWAGELANTAGKVINATKLEVEYQLLRKKVAGYPKIDFLEGN